MIANILTTKDKKLLLFLVMCLYRTLFCRGCTELYTKVVPVKLPLDKPLMFMKVGRLVECVYGCLQFSECVSVSFRKTLAACHLYISPVAVTMDKFSTVAYATVRQTAGLQTPRGSIGLVIGEMTWREAQEACKRDNGFLHVIDNDKKQKGAVKMATESDLEYVAFGAFLKSLFWKNSHQRNLNYTVWAENEPCLIGVFGVLSKSKGYRWESVSGKALVSGGLCEKR